MPSARAKNPPTILQRAVAFLARREHSRAELARKLARYQLDGQDASSVEAVLDQLEAKGMLSDERFAAALTRSRSERFGAARVGQELRDHGIDPELARKSTQPLKQTELERARAVWRRKFGGPANDEKGRARQMRFLAARGFSADVILRVVKGATDTEDS
ncbi:MAG: recombination regulator RecX [Gemmatimonadota bacterium]